MKSEMPFDSPFVIFKNPQMTKEYKEWLFVGVPKGANHFRIDENIFQYFANEWDGEQPQLEFLPPGRYTIVGRASELTEEQWEPIVERVVVEYTDLPGLENIALPNLYRDYEYDEDYETAPESGFSLVRSLGYENMDEVIILKKEA